MLLVGCAAPQTRGLIDTPPAEVAQRAEIDDVPFFPQKRYQCGPAALATVLAHHGEDVTAEGLVDEIYIPDRQGSLQAEIRASARGRGFVAYPLEPSMEALLAEVDAGRPVLVMQNLGLNWFPQWHYAVVVGYDLDTREVVLRSETIRRHVTGMHTFERTWRRTDQWAQVMVRPDDIPATAEPLPWVEAVHELEEIGRAEQARTGYRAATERWPGFRPAWFALGNAEYAAGEHAAAREAFTRTVALQSEAWDGWNNLAHALAADGCGQRAEVAAQCAVSLAPDIEAAQATLTALGDTEGNGACPPLPPCPVRASETENP